MVAYRFRCVKCGTVEVLELPFQPPLSSSLSQACQEDACAGDLTRDSVIDTTIVEDTK